MSNDMAPRPLSKTMKLRDIKVPNRFYQRHKTGFEVLDQVFGGESPGVLPGGSYLVTGIAGAGKTTLILQMIDAFAKAGIKVLFNAGEQSLYMIKMAADRINISGDFAITSFREANELIDYASEHKFDIVAQDSLQSLRDDEFPNLTSERLWLTVGKKLISMCTELSMTSFIVNHVTKDGTMRGSNELVHDADAHLHMSLNKDTGNRIVELKKNRFGPAAMPYEFTLTADGIDLRKAADGTDPGPRSSERKNGLIDLVRKLLKDGKKLSGYSHEEEPDIVKLGISGGAMRAALRMVEKQLQAEGIVVQKTIINRREHVYIDA